MRRSLKAAPAVALLAVGVLAGCSHPFHAGAAAVVGDDRISTDQLRTLVERGMAAVPANATSAPSASDVQTLDLTQLIQLSVLKQMAGELKVPAVTQAQIDKELTDAASSGTKEQLEQSAAAQGVDPQTLRIFAEVVAYEKAIIDALPVSDDKLQAAYDSAKASTYEQVHVAHILVATKAQADSILAQVKANPASFGALAKQYSTDTGSKDNGGDLGFAPRSAYVAEFANAAFAGADGSIVGPVQSQYGFHIIKVIAHRTISFADAKQGLIEQLNSQTFVTQFKAAAKKLGVSVSPRFGTWVADGGSDGLGAVQAPASDDLSTPTGKPSSPAPAPSATTPGS